MKLQDTYVNGKTSPTKQRRYFIQENRKAEAAAEFEKDLEELLTVVRRGYRLGFYAGNWARYNANILRQHERNHRLDEQREAFAARLEAESRDKRKAKAVAKPSTTKRKAPRSRAEAA